MKIIISLANKGRKCSPESIDKRVKARKRLTLERGYYFSEEVKILSPKHTRERLFLKNKEIICKFLFLERKRLKNGNITQKERRMTLDFTLFYNSI